MIYRRQRQQYIFAGVLAVIGVVNVLFFFILNQPARSEYDNLQGSIKQLQTQIAADKLKLTGLQKTSSQLEHFEKDRDTLLMSHMKQRNTGYSQLVSALDNLVQQAGVNKTRVAFNLNPAQKAGLNAVSITIPLEGGYNNVVDFIRELENSDTFFVITNIELATSDTSAPGPQPVSVASSGGPVALSLGLETYFYQ
jgi:Tfp pilus assembly protein PilO